MTVGRHAEHDDHRISIALPNVRHLTVRLLSPQAKPRGVQRNAENAEYENTKQQKMSVFGHRLKTDD